MFGSGRCRRALRCSPVWVQRPQFDDVGGNQQFQAQQDGPAQLLPEPAIRVPPVPSGMGNRSDGCPDHTDDHDDDTSRVEPLANVINDLHERHQKFLAQQANARGLGGRAVPPSTALPPQPCGQRRKTSS